MWAALGIALLGVVMRIDYRNYREPVFIWTCLGLVVAGAGRACYFSPPVNSARRWFGVGGLGIQPSELAKLARSSSSPRCSSGAMHRINEVALRAAADRRRRRSGWSR